MSVGLRDVNMKPDAIKAKLSKRKFSEDQFEDLKKKAADYRKKFEKSKFVKSHEPVLTTVLAAVEEVRMRDFNRPWIVKNLKLELLPIKPGSFKRGQNKVKLTKPFWIGKYEVTQEQYEKIMGTNPSSYKNSGKTAPVETISWFDAVEFCKKLTEKERKRLPKGYEFRLPTEAEWEYCCRAGTETEYSFGDSEADLYKYGNYCDKSNTDNREQQDKTHDDGHDKTAPVGSYKPNPWGLYDMHGNVFEWCLDWRGSYPGKSVIDPKGPEKGSYRVFRGGSWGFIARFCRSANRDGYTPSFTGSSLGFRLCLACSP